MRKNFLHIQKRLVAVLVFSSAQCVLQAQSLKQFSSRAFSVNEGLLANHVTDIAEDNTGFVWMSFGAGLQRFNGNDFETILPQKGLPETNHPRFFKLNNGNLWLGYHSGISAYNSVTGKFEVIYKTPRNDLKNVRQPGQDDIPPVMPVLETANAIWCWSSPERQFIAINKSTCKVADTFKLKAKFYAVGNFKRSGKGTLFLSFSQGIAEVEPAAKKLLHIYHFPWVKNLIYDYFPLGDDSLLLATNKGIFKADDVNGATESLGNYPADIDTGDIACISLRYIYKDLYVVAINNQLYIFNAATGKFLYRMVNRQNRNFTDPEYITSCMPDRFHNLWLLSFSGLIKVSTGMSCIKYYGAADARKNFSRCVFPDKKANFVITGSLYNQLSVFDTSGHLLKQFNIVPNTAEQQVSCILKAAKNKYLIFAMGSYSVYYLNTATMQLSPLYAGVKTRYCPLKVMGDTAAILAWPSGVVKVAYAPGKIQFKSLLNATISCALIDDKERLWIGGTGKYALLKGKDFADKTVFYLKENVVTKCFFQDSQRNVWLGTEDGLYKINPDNGAVLCVYKKGNGLADETIYSIQEDDNKNIWFSTNKGISCIYNNESIVNLYAADGLQGNEFNTGVSAKANDGELFFGGTNGVNSFYPRQIRMPGTHPLVILESIKVMDAEWQTDTAAWCIHRIQLPYTKNIITLDFTALGRYAPGEYHYRYKMQGVDKDWVDAGNTGRARYALPPGKYIFEYTAGATGEYTENAKRISIIITPPFWQTIWFKLMMIIAAATMLWSMMHLYNKRKYQKKLRQIKMQESIQQERHRISRDLHDNIGAYATALTAGAEQLHSLATKEDVQQAAENISANAKSIIASLQETIWVLNNDSISITDFADRFKVYAKKITQHNYGIQIRFHEWIEKDTELSPAEALHLFRAMQEVLHNALRHSLASLVNVEITGNNDFLCFLIKDNGKGFDVNQQSAGNGLYNMRHRCKEAGYDLGIVSNAAGTTVSLRKNHSFDV